MAFNFLKRNHVNKNAKNPDRTIRETIGGGFYSGVAKGSDSFVCMDKVASQFASLNYGIYKTSDRQKTNRHSLISVLKEPNLDDRHWNFFYQSAVDYFNGGCFWKLAKVNGEVVSMFRLNPAEVKIDRDDKTRRRMFRYNGYVYTSDEILYIPSRFNYSTLTGGKSIFSVQKDSFDTSDALETFTQSTFKNGLNGAHLVMDISEAYPDATAEQLEEIKNAFQTSYGGVQNAGKPILKKKGIEYSEIGKGTDARSQQLEENRKLQKKIINDIFQLPDDNWDIEKYFLFLNEFALKPMASQFQEAINSLLDEERYYFEFDFNGVMRSSLQQRIDAYTKQINIGVMSPNEARHKENLPPIEAGDNHFMPVNLMPLNDETINAYMAKQKNEINGTNPTNPDAQHFEGGDDKQ